MTGDLTQTAAALLEHCSGTVKEFEKNYIQTGQKYNIFKITGLYKDEVKICKILADLLDPHGSHYKGDYFLTRFIETINEKMPSPLIVNTKNAHVKTQYSTDINRYIDIAIEDGNIFIPIEVKIYAGDQENQVSHYYEFSCKKNKNKNIPVLYLTLNGKPPSNAKENEFTAVSFEHDILKWLNICLRNPEIEGTKPVFEVLKQLILSVKSICGILEDEKMEKAIVSLVAQSEDSVKAAIAIKQAVESFDNLTCELFKTTILDSLKKHIPDAEYNETTDLGGWYYISLPIKNKSGQYDLQINYDWVKMCVQITGTIKSAESSEKKALNKIMSELTGTDGEIWDNSYVWGTKEFSYPPFSDIEDVDLYCCKLYKEYSENTTEVVNTILKYINALNNAEG